MPDRAYELIDAWWRAANYLSAAVRTLVVRAREDLEIARQVRAVLSAAPPS